VPLTDFALVSDLVLSKKTNSDFSFSFLVFNLLAMLRYDSDFCSSSTRNPMSRSLVADPNQSLPRCSFCGGHRHHRDSPTEDVSVRTAMTMATKKTSTENLLRTVQRGKTEQQATIKSDEAEL
ncbi:unnamed protein product, partial [Hymenolepis diminuta]